MIDLQAVIPEELSGAIEGLSLAEARKIVSAIHRLGALPPSVRGVRRIILEQVRASSCLPFFARETSHGSQIDPFIKYTLETADGQVLETVRIPLEHPGRFSVCVSSQAGCGLGCLFCATGKAGLHRNLAAWEIVEQVRVVRRSLDSSRHQRVHGVVFQGMGEPFANTENVLSAVRVFSEPSALAIDSRAITICTAGVPRGIRLLAREAPKVRLAISITSARPEIRRKLMPLDRTHALDEVIEASVEHALITRIAPMWAVTLLSGINDSDEDARALADLTGRFTKETGLRPRISIIPFNAIDLGDRSGFARTVEEREKAFRGILSGAGIASHKRYSGGGDVHAACGQLASREARFSEHGIHRV